MRRFLPHLALMVVVPAAAFAQHGTPVDYHKADLIRTSGAFVLNATVAPTWLQDSTRFYYRSLSARGEATWFLVDPAKKSKAPLFDNVRLATAMSLAGDTIFDASKLPAFRLTDDEKSLRMTAGRRRFECTLAAYACTVTDTAKIEHPDAANWAVVSPDKKWEAFVHNYNVYVRRTGIRDKASAADSAAGRGGAEIGRAHV